MNPDCGTLIPVGASAGDEPPGPDGGPVTRLGQDSEGRVGHYPRPSYLLPLGGSRTLPHREERS